MILRPWHVIACVLLLAATLIAVASVFPGRPGDVMLGLGVNLLSSIVFFALLEAYWQRMKRANGKETSGFDYMQFMGGVMEETKKPRTKAELVDLLRGEGEKFAAQLEGVSEEFLGQIVTFPPGGNPPARSRFDMLMSVKEHEMHHRGQLMLIQRMLGHTPHLTREAEARRAAMQAQK